MAQPTINEEECIGCGNCLDGCPAGVLVLENDLAKASEPDECVECGQCVEDCPVGAIVLE